MSNPFEGVGASLNGAVSTWVSVTPSDGSDNVGTGNTAIGLWVGTGGNLCVVTKNGDTVTIPSWPDQAYWICGCTRVKSTGTTASNIFALIA